MDSKELFRQANDGSIRFFKRDGAWSTIENIILYGWIALVSLAVLKLLAS